MFYGGLVPPQRIALPHCLAAPQSYIADLKNNNALFPTDPTKRAKVLIAVGYVATEWYKTVGQLFNPTLSKEVEAHFRAATALRLSYMNDALLKNNAYIAGDDLSIADFYLFVTLNKNWTGRYLNVDISPYRVQSLPSTCK